MLPMLFKYHCCNTLLLSTPQQRKIIAACQRKSHRRGTNRIYSLGNVDRQYLLGRRSTALLDTGNSSGLSALVSKGSEAAGIKHRSYPHKTCFNLD